MFSVLLVGSTVTVGVAGPRNSRSQHLIEIYRSIKAGDWRKLQQFADSQSVFIDIRWDLGTDSEETLKSTMQLWPLSRLTNPGPKLLAIRNDFRNLVSFETRQPNWLDQPLYTPGSPDNFSHWDGDYLVPFETIGSGRNAHMTNTQNITDCSGAAVATPTSCLNYYEAWPVDEGKIFFVNPNHTFTETSATEPDDDWGLCSAGGCTKGNQYKTGVVKFVGGAQVNAELVIPGAKGSVPCAGSTYSGTSLTDWTDKGGFSRVLKTTWSCCCPAKNVPPMCKGVTQFTNCTYRGAPCVPFQQACSSSSTGCGTLK